MLTRLNAIFSAAFQIPINTEGTCVQIITQAALAQSEWSSLRSWFHSSNSVSELTRTICQDETPTQMWLLKKGCVGVHVYMYISLCVYKDRRESKVKM